jgi:transcriptional regulator with XRE-family HTH domain
MTAAEVAKTLGMSASKMSRMETGRRGLHPDDVSALLSLYRVPETRRDELMELVRTQDQPGWWQNQGTGLPASWKDLIELESRASRIQNFELAMVPGLLQTRDYAAAVIRGIQPTIGEAELERLVGSRMARQNVLMRMDKQFLMVLDEHVLHRGIGELGVMRRQLRHLVDEAERPNLTLRVVPATAGANAGLSGSFMVLDFADEPSIAYFENQPLSMFPEDKDDVAAYRVALGNIVTAALGPAESVELVSDLIERDHHGRPMEVAG